MAAQKKSTNSSQLNDEELSIRFITEEAKQRLVDWLKREGIIFTIIFTILGGLGFKTYINVERTAKEASTKVDEAKQNLIQFEELRKRFDYEMKAMQVTQDSLQRVLAAFTEEFKLTENAVRNFMSTASENNLKLKALNAKYVEETKKLENSKFDIAIEYNSNTENKLKIIKDILIENGFNVQSTKLGNSQSAILVNQNFSGRICYFDQTNSQKAEEILELLQRHGKFVLHKGDEIQNISIDFKIWILD